LLSPGFGGLCIDQMQKITVTQRRWPYRTGRKMAGGQCQQRAVDLGTLTLELTDHWQDHADMPAAIGNE
jgi:hypothetical protein